MQNREHAGAHDREKRHGFRESVDRVSPGLIEQQQNGRDQRAGVADTDPPDEIDDREAPADRDIDAPDADALDEQPAGASHQILHHAESDRTAEEPPECDLALENDAADFVGDGSEAVAFVDYRPDVYVIG